MLFQKELYEADLVSDGAISKMGCGFWLIDQSIDQSIVKVNSHLVGYTWCAHQQIGSSIESTKAVHLFTYSPVQGVQVHTF